MVSFSRIQNGGQTFPDAFRRERTVHVNIVCSKIFLYKCTSKAQIHALCFCMILGCIYRTSFSSNFYMQSWWMGGIHKHNVAYPSVHSLNKVSGCVKSAKKAVLESIHYSICLTLFTICFWMSGHGTQRRLLSEARVWSKFGRSSFVESRSVPGAGVWSRAGQDPNCWKKPWVETYWHTLSDQSGLFPSLSPFTPSLQSLFLIVHWL